MEFRSATACAGVTPGLRCPMVIKTQRLPRASRSFSPSTCSWLTMGVKKPGLKNTRVPLKLGGTLVFFNPGFFTPIVNQEQVEGENDLDARGKRWVFMTMGHLKPGVTPAQAVADLNSIGSYLEKTYPKDDDQRTFTLARPSLYGDYLRKPVKAFMTALMSLASLILLAACANLGI